MHLIFYVRSGIQKNGKTVLTVLPQISVFRKSEILLFNYLATCYFKFFIPPLLTVCRFVLLSESPRRQSFRFFEDTAEIRKT